MDADDFMRMDYARLASQEQAIMDRRPEIWNKFFAVIGLPGVPTQELLVFTVLLTYWLLSHSFLPASPWTCATMNKCYGMMCAVV